MKNFTKSSLTVILASVLLLMALIAGCTPQVTTTTQGTTKATTTQAGTTTTQTEPPSMYPDYLNLDGYYPIVKDGTTVTLSVGVLLNANPAASEPEDLWLFKYLTEYMNINFTFTSYSPEAWTQQKTLLFASGDVFDVGYGLNLSTTDMVLYGIEEEQLMPLNDYINADLTPSMFGYFSENPTGFALATASDGKVYSIPRIQVDTYITSGGQFLHETRLTEQGMQEPKTLDEFIELMRAWKEYDPTSTPIAGGYTSAGPMKTILTAYGVVPRTNAGSHANLEFTPSLYKGEVIIPAAQKDVYTAYVNTMKLLYDEKLVSADFFTLDNTAINAMVANRESIFLSGYPYSMGAEKFDEWNAMAPLTSELNATPVWDRFNPVFVGGVWLGADCAFPEVVMRWFDWYYTEQGCVYMWLGPMEGQEETMGIVPGWYFDENKAIATKAITDGKYANLLEYYIGDVSPGIVAGNYSLIFRGRMRMGGINWTSDIASLTPTTGDNNAQIKMYNKFKDYVVDGYPPITYVDSDISTEISDLQTLIGNYIQNQTARFITGDRPLTQLDAFFSELDGMGVNRFLEIHEEIYDNYLSALN